MQYVLHAYDYPDALERRMAARPDHLEGVRVLRSKGQFHLGGALLDADGRMIGSMLLIEFESQEAMDSWLAIEPYLVNRVWERVDIRPFRRADV